ncbi:cytochrome c biogenesis CcdA family protein [Candidatus Ruminimicrobium bovinum]|uniref:cytochrome c biogenesis CcdA family protein n=1 Tax=Candidatus Ruminimicrobium bovinum TaxID=3242779 RepID=UPI0039B8C422
MENLGNFPVITSFIAGILTFISPCILPLIPVYITLITGFSIDQLNNKKNILPALLCSLTFIAGFTTIFVILGLSVTVIGQIVLNNINLLRWIGGTVVIIFGIHLLGIIKIPLLYKQFSWTDKIKKTSNYFTIYLIGCAFALSWTPCVDPILASILLLASTSQTIGQGTFLLLVYSAGLAVPFILTALFVNKFLFLFEKIKQHYKLIEIITGSLLIIVGILVITNNFSLITNYFVKIFN